MKNYMLFISAVMMLLAACGNEAAKQAESLRGEVLAVHDEVMPRMSEIADLQKQMSQSINTMTQDTANLDMEAVVKAKGLYASLIDAETAMNEWMVGFHELEQQNMDPAAYLDALKGEQTKVNEVKEKMLTAIEKAQTYLKSKADE